MTEPKPIIQEGIVYVPTGQFRPLAWNPYDAISKLYQGFREDFHFGKTAPKPEGVETADVPIKDFVNFRGEKLVTEARVREIVRDEIEKAREP